MPSTNVNASRDVFSSSTSVEVSATHLCAKHTLQDLALRALNISRIGQEAAEAYAMPMQIQCTPTIHHSLQLPPFYTEHLFA